VALLALAEALDQVEYPGLLAQPVLLVLAAHLGLLDLVVQLEHQDLQELTEAQVQVGQQDQAVLVDLLELVDQQDLPVVQGLAERLV
jgi:hypothetical protein